MRSSEWTYLRVGVDTIETADRVLTRIVVPIFEERGYLKAHDLRTWFFMRYLDSTGLHLRIRVRDPRPEYLTDVEEELRSGVRGLSCERESGIEYIEQGYYVPEWRKWGGVAGVERAQSVFTNSSRLALAHLGRDRRERRAVDLLLMKFALDLLPPSVMGSFVYNYAWYWSGGSSRMLERTRPRIRAKARELRSQVTQDADRLRETLGKDPLVTAYVAALQRDIDLGGLRLLRVFNHMHLTANRLGVTTPEEALLAEVLLLNLENGEVVEGRDELVA